MDPGALVSATDLLEMAFLMEKHCSIIEPK